MIIGKEKDQQINQKRKRPQKYSHLIFDEEAGRCNKAWMAFSTNGAGATEHLPAKINPGTGLIPVTKIISKCITDLNGKHKTKTLLEDNIE